MINELSEIINEDLNDHLLYCIFNAPNSFDLLFLVCDLCVDKKASSTVKNNSLGLLNLIVNQLHDYVYGVANSSPPPILDQLRIHVDELILQAVKSNNPTLKRNQMRILHLVCIHFGFNFATKVLNSILNNTSIHFDSYLITPTPSPLITNFLKSLKLPFGADIHNSFSEVIKDPSFKTSDFWGNLLALLEYDENIELDLDILTINLVDQSQHSNDFKSLYYILRVTQACMEKTPKSIIRPKHRLCVTLVFVYLKLVNILKEDKGDIELLMLSISTVQKCMSNLSKATQPIHQHILCRALIDSVIIKNNTNNCSETRYANEVVSLNDENLKYGMDHSFKFRKIIPNPFKGDNLETITENTSTCLSRQLILDAIRSCIVDIPSFAIMLVESVTPDVMFNDLPWPDEDFLKVNFLLLFVLNLNILNILLGNDRKGFTYCTYV